MLDAKSCKFYLGLPGACKTLLMNEDDILPALLDGEEVWTTYWVNWNRANWHYFTKFEEVQHLRNVMVGFDEITDIWDPREFEKEGDPVRRWLRCHRKRHISITATTQDISFAAKSIAVIADSWNLLESQPDNLFSELFFGSSRIRYARTVLTLAELRQRAGGWDIPVKFDEDGEVIGPDEEFGSFKIKDIVHYDLDEYKIELVHRYCSKCASRQGEQILKADTLKVCSEDGAGYFLRKQEYCPKHKSQLLEIRESGMYDSDFEPVLVEQPIYWVPMIACPAGYKDIPYKGPLSDSQLALRRIAIGG